MSEDLNPFKGMDAIEIIMKLERLKETDIDAFFDLVFTSLSNFPDDAVKDSAEREKKIKAITRIIDHYLETEQYEKCQVLQTILTRIENEE